MNDARQTIKDTGMRCPSCGKANLLDRYNGITFGYEEWYRHCANRDCNFETHYVRGESVKNN